VSFQPTPPNSFLLKARKTLLRSTSPAAQAPPGRMNETRRTAPYSKSRVAGARTSVSAPWDGFPNLSPLRAQSKTTVDRDEHQRHGSAAAWPGQIFKFVPRARTSVSARWVFIGRTPLPGATSGVAGRGGQSFAGCSCGLKSTRRRGVELVPRGTQFALLGGWRSIVCRLLVWIEIHTTAVALVDWSRPHNAWEHGGSAVRPGDFSSPLSPLPFLGRRPP
jgi:hypothetical protein